MKIKDAAGFAIQSTGHRPPTRISEIVLTTCKTITIQLRLARYNVCYLSLEMSNIQKNRKWKTNHVGFWS